jgi:UDP-3-O-[3-hydroxymyristoyl] N-acetylglucosamine deacetylase
MRTYLPPWRGTALAGRAAALFMSYRRTLKRSVGCTGIGLHSGKLVRLDLRPAPAEHGIRFRRTDVGVEIPATLEHLGGLDHATRLVRDGVCVDTVEHLLSALFALGVDDAIVEVDGPEVPVLDGSAAPFVILIHEAGLKPLPVARRYLKVLRPVEVVRGGKSIRISPSDHFHVSYTIGFDHPLLRHQSLSVRVTGETFVDLVAPARTFGFLRDVETLRRNGLALGGSLENAVVIGETGVLNNKLRFEDEFVRHKVLDAIGDLALLGHPVVGHLEAIKAGHALHAALTLKLKQTPEAWTLVAHPQLPVLDLSAPPRLVPEPT